MTVQQDPFIGTDAGLRDIALRNLKRKREFFTHLVSYLTVNAMLWGIWLVIAFSWGVWFPWPVFPTLGWGVGLALHAYNTFALTALDFTPEQVQAEMDRLRQR
jgi:uncharacterized membrane protein (DUF485 family)